MNRLTAVSPRRRLIDRLGRAFLGATAVASLALLVALLAMIAVKGLPALSPGFFTQGTSRLPSRSGILPAIVGTVWIGGLSMLFAIPFGVGAAIYLNEFARHGRITSLLRASISNLAGVPSIVFGILGLAIFARLMGFGPSVLAAGLTLALLTLPIVIVVSEEALKSVPNTVREAAFGLGASRWQVVRHHVLPYALPGMLTASILALSRTMGETAPLILIGAAIFIPFLTGAPLDAYTALPIQAYYWALHADPRFHTLAWGAVLVLVAIVLLGNLAAIVTRDRFQRRYRW